MNPQWNESFLFENDATHRIHSSAYMQLLVLDKSRKGSKDELMGVVFIPMSEFFSAKAVAGKHSRIFAKFATTRINTCFIYVQGP